jgi:hypothetical protein
VIKQVRKLHKRLGFWKLLQLWWTIRGMQKIARQHEHVDLEPTADRAGRTCQRCDRYFAGLVTLALIVLGCTSSAAPTDPVVVILRDGLPECSGVAITTNQIMTAAHCLQGLERGDKVAFVSHERWTRTAGGYDDARLAFVNEDRDLAVLTSPVPFLQPVEQRQPVEGEDLWARSALFGETHEGELLPGIGFFRDTTITIRPGWSGSPVFGRDGKLVGIVHSCFGGWVDGHKFCLPYSGTLAVLP